MLGYKINLPDHKMFLPYAICCLSSLYYFIIPLFQFCQSILILHGLLEIRVEKVKVMYMLILLLYIVAVKR